MSEHTKVFCKECDWRGTSSEQLKGINPFEPETEIYGCPKCKSIDCFAPACSYGGCWLLASCGGPAKDGVYRWTCYKHAYWLNTPSSEGTPSPE